MSSNQGLLEQVLQEARSRAEEIRIEIATLKEKTVRPFDSHYCCTAT